MKLMKLMILMLLALNSQFSFAKKGTESGGGGDSSEMRVDEIRSDILNWIDNNGARGLELPAGITLNVYEEKMKEYLQPQYVVVGFVEKDDATDNELKVTVYGSPKTCRGFVSLKDGLPHILCNISRFNSASESDQYRLIHHEYAGLANVENNDQAASDYFISSQISGFLQPKRVLKLSVNKAKNSPLSNECIEDLNDVIKSKKAMRKPQTDEESVEYDILLAGWDSVAKSVSLTCSGVKLIELEKSFKARIGLLSRDKAEAIAEQVYQEAMNYYNKYSR